MGKLCLILFGFVTSFMVLVESQRQSCSTKNDCRENGCCYNNLCFYNSACSLYESLCKTRPGRIGCSCYRNSDCTSGCCFDSTCTVYDSKCGAKKCYYNFQCSSGCCKSYRCERTSEACKYNYRTTMITYRPSATMVVTRGDEYGSKSCYFNYECDSGYCKDYRCERTEGTTARPFHYRTTFNSRYCWGNWGCHSRCCKDNRCERTSAACYDYTAFEPSTTDYPSIYDYDDDDDYYVHRSSMSAGARVGLAFAILFVAIVKIVFWAVWCSRRRRVAVVRRTACARSGVDVAIVQHDHLQREHEWLASTHHIMQGPPPAYSPRPTPDASEDATQNAEQNPNQTNLASGEGVTHTSGGVPQGSPTGPPPMYSLSIAHDDNTQNGAQNPTQANLLSGERMAHTSGGVPQGPPTGPPPKYSLSVAPSAYDDNTQNGAQNPTLTDLSNPGQELVNTSGTSDGVPQGSLTGPSQTDTTQTVSTKETHTIPQEILSSPTPNHSQ